MTSREEAEIRWAQWAIESAYRLGLDLPSCLRLVLAIAERRRFVHIVSPATGEEAP